MENSGYPNVQSSLPKKTVLIVFVTILIAIQLTALAQVPFDTQLHNLDVLEDVLTEKLYVHVDRNIYSPGEDIWFKAYLLEGTTHVPVSTSDNLHVEIISPLGHITDSITVLLNNGVGFGDFHLDEKAYAEGTYRLRAYTHFMRNFGHDFFFTKDIFIKETSSPSQRAETQKSIPEYKIQFFPEGGELIQDIYNKLAFKATDQTGKGVNVPFTIYDDEQQVLKRLIPVHNGMGSTLLMPDANKRYYAILDIEGYGQKKFHLPEAVKGYSILVGNQFNDRLDFQINASPENVRGQRVKYIIQSRGVMFASNTLQINEPGTEVRIDKDKLPEGISCITVYDENDTPVCERLIFNQLFKPVHIDVQANKASFGTREKTELTIRTTDGEGNAIPANLSLSIVDQYLTEQGEKWQANAADIYSSILLNSDLKGKIEHPDFYFEGFNREKHYLLDLVMLTHGWRKYVWKEIIDQERVPLDFEYENGFQITGKLKGFFNQNLTDSKVTLVMLDHGFTYLEGKTDPLGNFSFNDVYLMDSTKVIVEGFNKRGRRNADVIVNNTSYISPRTEWRAMNNRADETLSLQEFIAQTKNIIQMQDSLRAKNNIQLEEILVKAKRKDDDGHSRLYRNADYVLDVDESKAIYPDIFELLKGRFPGVQVLGNCPDAHVIIRAGRLMGRREEATFLLDGFFLDNTQICGMSPLYVDKIEILMGAKASVYGSRGFNGIVAVYSKLDGKIHMPDPVGVLKITQKGYYRSREFYSPNYEEEPDKFTGKDLRNTLYWNPFISTNEKGIAKISYFNDDKETEYKIRVEGVGLSGGIGKGTLQYEVTGQNKALGFK